ncbi:MAG: hypothetical protein ABI459_04545 [Deltaproteobacteria bacterium]
MIFRLAGQINRALLAAYDRNRLSYMLIWFPIYQILAMFGLFAPMFVFMTFYKSTGLWGVSLPFVAALCLVPGVPILLSWHLSFFLFAHGYFSALERIGVPLLGWMISQIDEAISLYRKKLAI